MNPAAPGRTMSGPLLLAVVLAIASLLRVPALSVSPPGVWVDEAIGALQGDALVRGRRLPDEGTIRYPRWPAWCLAEGFSARVLGPTTPAARLPAAILGLLGVLLAWPAARVFGGPAAGAAAAAFLAGSLWFVGASRLALPCVLVVPETLLVGWLLLRDEPVTVAGGLVLVLVCAAAPLGYSTSLVTPLLAAGLLAARIRVHGPREARAEIAVLLVMAAAVAFVCIGRPESLIRSRFVSALGPAGPAGWVRQSGRVLASWVRGTSGAWGYWHIFPPGKPRVTPVELALVCLGFLGLVRGGSPRWKRLALAGWVVLALAPEIAPGDDLHLLRGLPTLAPAAIIAGRGAALLVEATGRPGIAVLAVALGLNAVRTAWITYVTMPYDPVARGWYLAADREAAYYVRAIATHAPVLLTPAPTVAGSPLLLFQLREPMARDEIRGADIALSEPRLARVFREPLGHQPVLFVFRSAGRLEGRVHLGLTSIDGVLAYGREALAAGRAREAEAHFRGVVAQCPDSGIAHGALGLALAAQGRWREAAEHLRFARPWSPAGSPCAIALAEAERRLAGNRGASGTARAPSVR